MSTANSPGTAERGGAGTQPVTIDPAARAAADTIRKALPHFDGSLGRPRHAAADDMERQLEACEEG